MQEKKKKLKDLIRYFYSHFTLHPGCAFSTIVRGKDISMSLVEFGAFLDVPSEGFKIVCGFTPDTPGWENYNKMDYFFSVYRIMQQEFYV
ncbi:hypothetical protein RYX36_032159 [Vicia faba]